MKVIEWTHFLENGLLLDENRSFFQCSMTVGIFDGVHRGHQVLIKRIVSHNAEFCPVVITFRQNHKIGEKESVTKEEGAAKDDIQSFQQRLESFEKLGIQIVIIIDFTEEFKRMKGSEFLEILVKHSNVGFFAIGSNFRCGYQLDTDALLIQKFFADRNIPVEIVPQVMEGALPVSSSRIRAALADGDIQLAGLMLGEKAKDAVKTVCPF